MNMWSGQGDPAAFEAGLITASATIPCPSAIYSKCIRQSTKPWCSWRTRPDAGITHDDNPTFFIREAFPRVFSLQVGNDPCE